MMKFHSNADEIVLALSKSGLDITVNDKCYSINLNPSESSTLGIMLMRQAHEISQLESGTIQTPTKIS